ncbi:hypothetical protein B0H14DRAFT_3460699 [Mycena olivaceomarginata]|nr:hypothetical protein B0H14DRAFT_3460699 [Mycena olivaceomarginata]
MSHTEHKSTAQNSTDDEANNTAPSKCFTSRYHFEYPNLVSTNVPSFRTKTFWDAFHTSDGRAFLKLLCCIRHPRYESSRQDYQELLVRALPELCFALSQLNASKELPKDVTLALTGLNRVMATMNDVPYEFTYLTFPQIGATPFFSVDAQPPTSKKPPTDAELPPTKSSSKRIRNSSDEEEVRVLSDSEIPSTSSAKKVLGKAAQPASKKVKLESGAGD